MIIEKRPDLPLREPVPPCTGWLAHNTQACHCYAEDREQPHRAVIGEAQLRYEAQMDEIRRDLAADGVQMLRPVTRAQYHREHIRAIRTTAILGSAIVALPVLYALIGGALAL